MPKNTRLGIAALVVIMFLGAAGLGLFFWARAVLSGEVVRTAVAAQLTKALGQPVTIGAIGARIFPRVTMALDDVRIGQPARVTVGSFRVGTDFRALLSKRIEHAVVRLTRARIELPLPTFAVGSAEPLPATAPSGGVPSTAPSRSSPVEIVSVDDILLSGVDIVSGGRTLHGDVDLVPQAQGVTIRTLALSSDTTTVNVTGQVTDLVGPSGELTIKAGGLNFPELVAFVTDFSKGVGLGGTPGGATRGADRQMPASPMNLSASLEADRATFGSLALDRLAGRAHITPEAITLESIHFGVFGGRYDGSLTLRLGETPEFRLGGSLADVDMAAATRFAGGSDLMTGRLSGRIDLSGGGSAADSVIRTARGTARVEVTDGSVKGLGLVRSVVLVTSMRSDSRSQLSAASANEPFSRLGMTLNVAGGSASTQDLRFESKDLLLAATGTVRLDGSAVDLTSLIQLSDALSAQAGRDLQRYTQQDGRVTIPATVTGSIGNLQVSLDVGDMAKRAIANRANEEAKKALQKALSKIIKR